MASMPAYAATSHSADTSLARGRPTLSAGLKRLGLAYAWITFATIGIVSTEPAPYDLLILGALVLFPLLGMVRVSVGTALYFSLWMANIAAGLLAATLADNIGESAGHIGITLHLAVSSVLVMAFVAARPEANSRLIMSAYVAAALAASLAGLIGYFNLTPSAFDMFTEYGRLRGTFKDPNVLGAFLVPALLYAFNRILHRGVLRGGLMLAALPLLFGSLLLTFSRGAWSNLTVSLAVYAFVMFGTAATNRQRVKLILTALVACMLGLGILAAAKSVPQVAELMSERASFEQNYDQGPEGRFGGQEKAVGVILSNPLGIGATAFAGKYHHEDAHEVYLSMFLSGGWLGGISYLVLVLLTVWLGLRHVLSSRGGDGTNAVLCAAFIGMALEGLVIDTDHWRHFFLLMGAIWGTALAASVPRHRVSA
jgi:hypothetical protein